MDDDETTVQSSPEKACAPKVPVAAGASEIGTNDSKVSPDVSVSDPGSGMPGLEHVDGLRYRGPPVSRFP